MSVPFQALYDQLAGKSQCWGCGAKNPGALDLTFEGNADEEGLDATWVPLPSMAGPPGLVHGGAQATALDCMAVLTAAHWAARRKMDPVPMFVTADMSVRFHRPVALGQPLALVGQVLRFEPRRLGVDAELWDNEEELCTRASFTLHRTDQPWAENPYLG